MRMMVATVLALAALAGVLWLHPSLRQKAEKTLLGERQGASARLAARPRPADDAPAPVASAGTHASVQPLGDETEGAEAAGAPEQSLQGPPAPPAEEHPTPPEGSGQRSEGEPPSPSPGPTPAASRSASTPRIRPPAPLQQVRWGMTATQIRDMFHIDWHSEDFERGGDGTLVLVSYLTRDRTQRASFHLSGDALYKIEVHLRPADDLSLEQLEADWRERFATQYAALSEAQGTRWSDGVTTLTIRRDARKDHVVVQYARLSASG